MIKFTLALCIIHTAFSAFDYRESSPGSLFPFSTAAVDESLPDTVSNPAYIPCIGYPYISFTGSRPYTLDEIYNSTIRAGYSSAIAGFQLSWNRYGFDQYCENTADISCGIRPMRFFSFGFAVQYYNISINTREISLNTNLFDGKVSILISPAEWLRVSFQQNNLASIFLKERRDLLYPGWGGGVSIRPIKGLSLIWNITQAPYALINSISASANMLKHLSLKVGYSPEAETYSASLSFVYKYLSISYGIQYHVSLGFTHSVGVTLSSSAMDIESLEYSNVKLRFREQDTIVKMDISTCTPEELKKIPGLDPAHAERIIAYRSRVGHVSHRCLLEIGMTKKQIALLQRYAYGIMPDGKKPKLSRSGKRRKNRLFSQLLALGLSATDAMDISEAFLSGNRNDFNSKVDSLSEIDTQKKREIHKLCADSLR